MFDLLSDLYDDFFNDYSNNCAVYDSIMNPLMATDIYEDEKGYHFEVEMPGVKKEDVRIEYDYDKLTIKIDNESKLVRDFRIKGIDFNSVDLNAKLENGILYVFLPKEVKTKRNINIQ
ncbi:MAG: Hsp20 family protein [Bacilli bacterium]|nr:Hsp20 family protein [Bacilli bacterium]